jgi:hypothetical protein
MMPGTSIGNRRSWDVCCLFHKILAREIVSALLEHGD